MLCSSCPKAAFLLSCLALAMTTTAANDVDYSSLSCPPSSGLDTLTTPTYGTDGAVFTVCSSINISAPVTVVREAVLDFKSYHLWNSFVLSVSVPSNVTQTPQDLYVGMPMVFTTTGLVAGLNTTSNEVLTVVNGAGLGANGKAYLLVSWRYDDKLGGIGARAEHPVVIVDLGGGSSRVLSYETYYVGLITLPIAILKSSLEDQFNTQAIELKTYVESIW